MVLFVPHDARIPKIRVRTRQLGTLAAQRVVVVIDAWSTHSRWVLRARPCQLSK